MKQRSSSPPDASPGWLSPLPHSFRRWGYLQARLDELGRIAPLEHPDLREACADAPVEEIARWRSFYCGSIGAEFMHLVDRERCEWWAEQMETEAAPVDSGRILQRLAQAELFERFLHRRYVGSKRYSLEGAAALVPLLDALLDAAVEAGAEISLIGMSHRGRLNVLANVVGVPGPDLFSSLEDVDPRSVLGRGDVKYHLGATGTHHHPDGRTLLLHLASNPSHLEAVNPVLMGRTRARQLRLGEDGTRRVVSLCLHGDAAFAGQGIAAETLNLARLPGYSVGGTVHVLVNNLIGFTASPASLHSSPFASDLAKRQDIPVLHVCGEDPAAVVRAGRLAMAYRARFQDDVLVDLIGYRRYGHSEVEDPTTTAPRLYEQIDRLGMLHERYAERIGADPATLGALVERIESELSSNQERGRESRRRPRLSRLPGYWSGYQGGPWSASMEVPTAADPRRLREVGEALLRVPPGFTLHPKLEKLLEQRREMLAGDRPLDFGFAEALALGTLLREGRCVRLSGQDSRRGTFNHRNAALIDPVTGNVHLSLAHLHPEQARVAIVDSPLSEAAVLGYEYGFSRDTPEGLVLWEAQFGDFANGAQIILDQFIAAGEDKWDLLSGLVLLLPHGYEGQGPEHSSARLERFLQLAAEHNIQICQPSTAAQYFHLLRRQALRSWRKPLVVLMPKGLLRARPACSDLEELSGGSFQTVLTEPEVEDAERILVCSGKVVHELRAERERRGDRRTTVVALAQLYPFPQEQLLAELERHPRARKVLWVQEEPANMGAVSYVRPELQRLAGERHVTAVKRSASASPATGSAKAHRLEQEALIRLAFRGD